MRLIAIEITKQNTYESTCAGLQFHCLYASALTDNTINNTPRLAWYIHVLNMADKRSQRYHFIVKAGGKFADT